jgi:hypothetical protein
MYRAAGDLLLVYMAFFINFVENAYDYDRN